MSLSSPLSSSASTVITETINGSYDFKITGYSLNKGIGIGKCLTSETFTVGGYSWKIRFYPDGVTKHEEGADAYVSIFVALINATDVKAQFEIALLDQSRDEKRVLKIELRTFTSQGCIRWIEFLKQTELEADYLKDYCLHIRCRLSVCPRTEVREINPISIPPSDIFHCLGRLLESGEGSDVSFEIEGQNLSAHKFVLAIRSPVFKAQFFGGVKDENTHSIKIEEMKAPIFKMLLHFIYWDSLPNLKKFIKINSKEDFTLMFQHLFVAADRYHIDRLSMICADKLYDDIAIDTAATTLSLAEQHNCLPLKLACLKFIALPENFQAMRKTDAFKYLKESFPSEYMELLEYVAGINEEKIIPDKKRTGSGGSVPGQRVGLRSWAFFSSGLVIMLAVVYCYASTNVTETSRAV